ncbi:hypothetical protein HPB52_003627 [Rhipicephalus sanguineus]|uniref:Reverse transcriptase zinc-binding domain-containing protein n=1 Tax=Rhipicephalus sanguineus TaxID=34632 RepID=A0A9D4PBV6_RHISA|nr:hypothetical protein HPB52_003627 [Rhipicephalus sanguineus]
MLDTYVDGKRVRFTNVYAPVTRADTNSFFKELHASLAEPLPHVILGDFNCVVDSMRDIRGPGRGGSTYHAKELVKILRHLRLTDAWVHLHDDTFGATRGLPLTGSEGLRVLAYADDVSLFVRNPSSLERFRHIFRSYAEVSGAQLNEAKSKALLFGAFPADAIGNISIVTTVKVLGVFYTCEGVAAPTWTRVLERAQRFTERASQLDLTLHEKALAAKTSVCALALHVSRVAVMPAKAATQLNRIITSFMWNGKPPLLRRSLLQMAVSEGGLGLPHALTLSKILALKTARSLFQASDYLGRGLLLYWSGASNNWLGASRQPVPLAETPSQFYKGASAAMRMLSKEAPGCDVDADPPARIAEVLNRAQLDEEEKAQAKNAKRAMPTYIQGLPRETHDFLWKKAWNVLPTRQRLHKLGIVPNARCPNCREIETQRHALLDCTAAKPVWRIVARCFGIRPPPYHKRNKSAFARLVTACTLLAIWKRRSLAEARRSPVRATFPVVAIIRLLVWTYLSEELEASGEEKFLRRWHTKFFFLRAGKLVSPITPY